jgi:hypothetical protein
VPEALITFAASLDYFASLFQLHRARLSEALSRLAIRLGDTRIPVLLERFVAFHERLYAHSYRDQSGEYAV